MLTGFNNNITYKNQEYHIQTENRGTHDPIIITLIYCKGAIVASKKTNYTHLINENDFMEGVRQTMETQHRDMIKALLAGEFDR